jgi:two-component system response regulator FixJ
MHYPKPVKRALPKTWRRAEFRPGQIVVIVDDDQALLEALTFSLELEGFEVRGHRSAETVDAEALPKTRCCLVIDYKLPDLNGIDLLDRLRRQAVALPAIIITSHAKAEMLTRCRALGAAVVEKPLLGDGLLTAIRNALARSAAPVPLT